MLSGHVLSISETGCKDLGKGLPSALSPKEKILVESFETKKKKEVFLFVCLFVCLFKVGKKSKGDNRNSIHQIFIECLLSTGPWAQDQDM